MTESEPPIDDVGSLAEKVIAEKREEVGNESQARELYDVPSASAADMAEEQAAGDQSRE